jgi:hypothetical protein
VALLLIFRPVDGSRPWLNRPHRYERQPASVIHLVVHFLDHFPGGVFALGGVRSGCRPTMAGGVGPVTRSALLELRQRVDSARAPSPFGESPLMRDRWDHAPAPSSAAGGQLARARVKRRAIAEHPASGCSTATSCLAPATPTSLAPDNASASGAECAVGVNRSSVLRTTTVGFVLDSARVRHNGGPRTGRTRRC